MLYDSFDLRCIPLLYGDFVAIQFLSQNYPRANPLAKKKLWNDMKVNIIDYDVSFSEATKTLFNFAESLLL